MKKRLASSRPTPRSIPGKRMIVLKSPEEIDLMRRPNVIVAETHLRIREEARPGMSTWDLEEIAQDQIAKHGVTSAFLNYRGYPCTLCTSINDAIVHGIPSRQIILKEGDLVSVDFGVISNEGFVGDAAISFVLATIPIGVAL